MTQQTIIDQTVAALQRMPLEKAREVAEFVAFLQKRIPEQHSTRTQAVTEFAAFLQKRLDELLLTQGIQKLSSESSAFAFLADEEDLYSVDDLMERYDAEG